jgi:hypothetical protein
MTDKGHRVYTGFGDYWMPDKRFYKKDIEKHYEIHPIRGAKHTQAVFNVSSNKTGVHYRCIGYAVLEDGMVVDD